jgi:hypothetical protein
VTHCADDDLIAHYYGEVEHDAGVAAHLGECPECAESYRVLAETLGMVPADPVPDRGPQYGLEVWQRIRPLLPEAEESWFGRTFAWNRLVPSLLALVLLAGGFLVGRSWPRAETVQKPGVELASTSASDARHRVLLLAVADHLDRSDRVLTDIMNAPDNGDISAEQGWADDLLATSRLYRQDALDAGERAIAGVLDDLERALLEIVHSPAKAKPADLELMRRQIDAASLLFKVRVMSDDIQRRGQPSEPAARGRSLTPVSRKS